MIIPETVKDNKIGKRFGKLTVIEFSHIGKYRRSYWKCLCDCGGIVIKDSSNLTSGNSRSCGCLLIETIALPYGRASLNKLYAIYKRGAKRRGLEFEIPMTEFERLTSLNCFYCGAIPSRIVGDKSNKYHGTYTYNGLDRVDNFVGYVLSNVVPCCSKCNFAKREMSYSEFKSWIMQASDYLMSKQIGGALCGK